MIKQTPEQYDLYASRLKFELDEASRLESTRLAALQEGRKEGREQGREEGELIGRIVILQDLLELTEPTRDELSHYTLPQMKEVAERLRTLLRNRSD